MGMVGRQHCQGRMHKWGELRMAFYNNTFKHCWDDGIWTIAGLAGLLRCDERQVKHGRADWCCL